MIQLLFTVLAAEVAAEVAATAALLFKTPFRNLIVLGLDRLKRGRGPVVVKTVAGTALVVLASTLYSMVKIQTRSEESASLTSTDQVLLSRHLLEASLLGYSLFLSLVIDRLHHYIRELRGLRANVEGLTKHIKALEESMGGCSCKT